MLTNIFEAIEKDRRSTISWRQGIPCGESEGVNNWLFLPQGAELQALEQLEARYDVQFKRRWYRRRTCDWELYCNTKIWDGVEVRRQRCEMRAANEEVPFNNGAWLFS